MTVTNRRFESSGELTPERDVVIPDEIRNPAIPCSVATGHRRIPSVIDVAAYGPADDPLCPSQSDFGRQRRHKR